MADDEKEDEEENDVDRLATRILRLLPLKLDGRSCVGGGGRRFLVSSILDARW